MPNKRHIVRHALKATIEKAENGELVFIASDETLDRQGEVVKASEWDLTQFEKSPRLLVDHDYRVQSIVGVAKKVWQEGNILKFVPTFHEITEQAVMVKQMIEQGVLDTVSVGFCRRMSNGKGVNELMEISFVAVPANPNARLLAAKSVDAEAIGKIKTFIKEAEIEEGGEFVDHILTEEDLINNPELAEDGLKVGDTIGIPSEAEAIIQGEEAPAGEAVEEAPATEEKATVEIEKKDVTEDIIVEAKDRMMAKYSLIDAVFAEVYKFLDAFYLDTVNPEQGPELVAELCERLKNVTVGTETKVDEKGAVLSAVLKGLIEQKEGRTLSGKNRDTIVTAIDAMKSGIGALESLLDSTDEKSAESEVETKVEAPAEDQKSAMTLEAEDYLAFKRLLRTVNTVTANALRDLKR